MLISTSFLSSNNIPKDLKKLNETSTDYIHVDVMDGKFVPNKTMPFREMKNIYKYTSKRLDVHLMVKDPKKCIDDYATLNTEYITIHEELTDNVESYLKQIKSYGIKAGLAIKPDTKVSNLVPYLPFIDLILVMSVEPGQGGQKFIEDTPKKIDEIKVLLKEYKSKIVVSVDGGINNETSKLCKKCDILVSGSYIINSSNFEEKINSLR